MIPKECKRLAEVDFPIAVVSKHSAREKTIRHGHPSTLHLWWARRPLAACRAVLLALLLPDPCDEKCPPDFKKKVRELLPQVMGTIGPKEIDLRRALLRFIGDFANWDLADHPVWLEASHMLVKAAHEGESPLVVDPFAGGGSIPLEALRLGCDVFASDLNPVACLINKVLLEDIPRQRSTLAEELRRVGADIKRAAEKDLAECYPIDPDGARPIAYLWARTVRCEAPNCGADIPLMRSFWLCKKAGRRRALRPKVVRSNKGPPVLELEIFTPNGDNDVRAGTVSRAKATCICCDAVLHPDRVRAQLIEQRGGADVVFDASEKRIGGARLLAVVTLHDGEPGRHYRLPTDVDYKIIWRVQQRLKRLNSEPEGNVGPIPDEALDVRGIRHTWVMTYGVERFSDLFTARQKLALATITRLISKLGDEASREAAALAVSKLSELACSICAWEPIAECTRHIFGRQAIPIAWDFGEGVLTASSSGSFDVSLENTASGIDAVGTIKVRGTTQIADAANHPLPDDAAAVWFTDPPYYDAVAYAYLSDFFFVWLKRALPGHPLLRDRTDATNTLTPKESELVVDRPHRLSSSTKDANSYENGMARAFAEGRRVLSDNGIGSVVFAHKTTEGWEALLSGLIRGGWTITGSWPISTEMGSRLNARDTASLATSVHLVCRPRPEDAPVGDWGLVLRELPKRVADWMNRLQEEGVRGADLVFACIGPALEIYSRYSKVVDAEEREIPLGGDAEAKEPHLRGYLAYVWEVVGRMALEQVLGTAEAKARNGAAGALEEDARLTALFLWTMQTTDVETTNGEADEDEETADDEDDEAQSSKKKAGFSLPFDVVRRFAQPLGIHLDNWERRIVDTEKGVVRLLPVSERARLLFGDEGADAVADWLQSSSAAGGTRQMTLFGDESPTPKRLARRSSKSGQNVSDESLRGRREATTLDRVHMAMLLQASGRTNALRALLKAEQERSPDFVRLSNALSALYPSDSEEKRLLDAMLLAVPK